MLSAAPAPNRSLLSGLRHKILDLRFRFFRWWLAAEISRQRERNSLLESDPELLELNWVQSKLKQVPWWPVGHLRCAEIALQTGDLVFAANSLSAVGLLDQNGQHRTHAALLQGKLYIAVGQFARAVEVLKPAIPAAKDPAPLREELIAALVGLEDYREALAVLQQIAEDKRGPELSTMKVFLDRKLSGQKSVLG